jgi:hypothetical protein
LRKVKTVKNILSKFYEKKKNYLFYFNLAFYFQPIGLERAYFWSDYNASPDASIKKLDLVITPPFDIRPF